MHKKGFTTVFFLAALVSFFIVKFKFQPTSTQVLSFFKNVTRDKKKVTREENNFQQERTLLIIQGSWRSFDTVVDSVVLNLIFPNSPCDVVLSLDEFSKQHQESSALEKLSPYLLSILIPTDSKRTFEHQGNGVEFSQIVRALDNVNTSRYTYIMKTRTDHFIHRPLSFKTAAGRSVNFSRAFRSFVRQTRLFDPILTPCDIISRWIWSGGGLNFYLEHAENALGENPPEMLWSPHPNIFVTSLLQQDIQLLCARHSSFNSPIDYINAKNIISFLVRKHNIMWLQGSTWISWGFTDSFIFVYNATDSAFFSGIHDWRAVPLPYHYLSRPLWSKDSIFPLNKVTEIVIRLAHVLSGVTLIELRSKSEMLPSFRRSCVFHCFNRSEQLFSMHLPVGAILLRPPPHDCSELLRLPLSVASSMSSCFSE